MTANASPTDRDVTIDVPDGRPLVGRLWTVERPRGIVVVAHGLGEHGGSYGHVAEALGRIARVDVMAVDLRGHGRSPGVRGAVGRYEDLCDDLRAAVAWAAARHPGLPRFAIGHSNGGQVVLRSVIDGGLDVSGIVLSNPALRVVAPIPRWKRGVGHLLRRFAPAVTLDTGLDLSALTRDPAMIEERRVDPLRHARVNASLFFGMVEGGASIAVRAGEVTLPVLVILGESDPIIDPAFTVATFAGFGSADKTLLTFPEMLHEPFNEVNRADVLEAVGRWIGDRLPVDGDY